MSKIFVSGLLPAILLLGGCTTSPALAGHTPLSGQIDTYLARLEGHGFSGAMLVAQDDQILARSFHGFADQQKKIPASEDTLFGTGSVTKQFTAAAILALESDGKLHVADTISNYLPNVPEDKASITIHHLLTHMSGLVNGLGGDHEKISRDDLVRLAMESDLESTPGERHAYSNVGYSLLGAIVERVSGQGIDEFSRERLFQPAGMDSTGYFLFPDETARRRARGYSKGEDYGRAEKVAALGGEVWNVIGNGGVYTTMDDMHDWMVALDEGKVLTGEARNKFFHPHVVAQPDYRGSGNALHYAYGWYVWKQPSGKTLVWHLGGNGVENFAVRHHVDDRHLVIYASNVSEFHDPVYPVPAVERLLAGDSVEMPPQVVALPTPHLTRYEGRYRASSGSVLSVAAKDQALRLEGEGQEALSFVLNGGWQPQPELARFNPLTEKAVEDSRTGNYSVLLESVGPEMTVKRLGDFESLFWKKRHARLGDHLQTRVLGTVPSRSRKHAGRTLVAIDFQRGTDFREYLWTPGEKIDDWGLTDSPVTRLLPISEKCFAAFDPAQARRTEVCFKKTEGKGLRAVIEHEDESIELESLTLLP